ncbi:hypothetical protein [Butyrivibrio sp. AD3002]|uniref:hypothetical protein n=1 Tax=Butyrivibrio sp. AD3002 TaxID=1280670 RepID=UPI0003B7026B|nr:hypothetical protein [Butyrivibrio sp. AD3002]
MNDYSKIDIERLRKDIEGEAISAFYAGGYGAALVESFDIKHASANELIDAAKKMGISIERYRIW